MARQWLPWRKQQRTEAEWVEVELTYAIEYAERVNEALQGGAAPVCANCGHDEFVFDLCITCGKLYIGPL